MCLRKTCSQKRCIQALVFLEAVTDHYPVEESKSIKSNKSIKYHAPSMVLQHRQG